MMPPSRAQYIGCRRPCLSRSTYRHCRRHRRLVLRVMYLVRIVRARTAANGRRMSGNSALRTRRLW